MYQNEYSVTYEETVKEDVTDSVQGTVKVTFPYEKIERRISRSHFDCQKRVKCIVAISRETRLIAPGQRKIRQFFYRGEKEIDETRMHAYISRRPWEKIGKSLVQIFSSSLVWLKSKIEFLGRKKKSFATFSFPSLFYRPQFFLVGTRSSVLMASKKMKVS